MDFDEENIPLFIVKEFLRIKNIKKMQHRRCTYSVDWDESSFKIMLKKINRKQRIFMDY